MATTQSDNSNGVREQLRRRYQITNPPNLDAFATWLIAVFSVIGNWLLSALQAFANWLGSLNWRVVAWNTLTMPLVGLLYWVVNAQGIRSEFPIFATKLYKLPLPGFSYLREYEGVHTLDLAHILAVLLLGFVWYFWIVVVKVMLYGHDDVVDPKLNRSTYYIFLFTLAGVLILGDAIVFYCGLFDHAGSMWGETSPFVPLVATLLYMGLLAATSMVHVHLTVRHKASSAHS